MSFKRDLFCCFWWYIWGGAKQKALCSRKSQLREQTKHTGKPFIKGFGIYLNSILKEVSLLLYLRLARSTHSDIGNGVSKINTFGYRKRPSLKGKCLPGGLLWQTIKGGGIFKDIKIGLGKDSRIYKLCRETWDSVTSHFSG